jgi:hypothetical protein
MYAGELGTCQAQVGALKLLLSSGAQSSSTLMQDGVTGPLRAERDALKERLDEASTALRDATVRLEDVTEERDQLQYQVTRLDEKLLAKDRCSIRAQASGIAQLMHWSGWHCGQDLTGPVSKTKPVLLWFGNVAYTRNWLKHMWV